MTIWRVVCALAIFGFATPASAQLLVFTVPGPPLPKCPAASLAQRQKAIAEADRHLPRFWQTYREAWIKSGRFLVLTGFQRRDGTFAYIWSEILSVNGKSFQSKLLDSDSKDLAFRKNDKIVGQFDSVIDWGVKSSFDGRWYGLFLRRATLPNCTKAQRDDLMARHLTSSAVP